MAFGGPIVAEVGIDGMIFSDDMLYIEGMLYIDCVLPVNCLLLFDGELFPALLWPAAMCCCPCKVSGCMLVVPRVCPVSGLQPRAVAIAGIATHDVDT